MRKQKLLSVILAGMLCILSFGSMTTQAEEYWPSGPEVQAESAVVMEASTGAVLYEKNAHEQLYPASITKIMTTLLAVENSTLDEEVTFSYESVHNIERDSTHIFRDVGEIMTLEECLYAVMLGSANDCAYAVAEHVGKGYDNFIAMMNDKASQLGCQDTHFNNPHGLTDQEHYTSAYDMALISKAALENETFRVITGTKRYTIPCTNKHPDEETLLVNHHKMLTNYQGEKAYLYDYCIGGKTGYTALARNTLVTFAEKDNMTLICVVMKTDSKAQYTETRQLLDYCFDNFTMWNVSQNQSEYQVNGTANREIFDNVESFAMLDEDGQIILPKTIAFEEASYEIRKNEEDAAIDSDTIAVMEYTYAGRIVGGAEIKIANVGVDPYPFHHLEEENERTFLEIHIKYIVIGIGAVIILALVGVLVFYLINNFYIIRHKFLSKRRRRSKFKTIRRGKHTKWRTRW